MKVDIQTSLNEKISEWTYTTCHLYTLGKLQETVSLHVTHARDNIAYNFRLGTFSSNLKIQSDFSLLNITPAVFMHQVALND